MEVSEYLTSTQEQRAERKAKYLERKALLESGQDADRMRAQDRAIKALFLLQEHINGNRVLNDIERVTLSGIVAERSLDSFFFFAKYVLGMDLLTEQTHKRWADDLQKAVKRRKKRLMRMKPRGTYKTSVYGIAFILWLWGCVSPQIRIFYTSANSLLLQEVADKLNQYIGTAKSETLFSLIFGITKDSVAKNTSDVFNITGRSGKGFSLVFRTSGGSSVGIHPNICIVDDPCFVGETPVLTSRGYVPIKDIRVGDLVMTRSGYKEVLRSWKTRENADVMDYRINGRILSCTPKHKIITEQGKKEISQLKDEIIIKFEEGIWKSEKLERPKLLSIWGLNTGDILTPKIYHIVNISWQVAMLIVKLLFYTVRFGFSTMALFLKDFMFTTRMIISTKTNFLTSNLSAEGNIIQNIQRGDCQIPGKEKLITSTLQKSELQLMNGIAQRRVGKRPEKFTTLYQILKKRVNVVARSFLQKISQKQGKSIVQKNVGLRGTSRRKADVYNLTVKDVHEFIANGILVSNCDQNDRDSETTRQGKIRWFDGLTPLLVPFFDPKTGIELETILYIGTPWHMRDLTWHIQEMNKKLPEDSSWDIESESVFDEDRQARYPEFFPMSKILEIKASISDVFFSCQYECSPLPEGMQIFDLKKLFFIREDQLALGTGEWLCVFDPAQGKGHNDYAAVWWLHYQNEKITVYSAIDEKIELNLIVHQIAHRNREFGCRHMIFENNGMGLIEDSLKAAHSRLNWHITIDSIHHSTNKEERIISMQPVLYSGQVQFMADYEQRYPEAMSQLVFYGAYGHDDFPDCLQMGIEYFMQPRFKFQRYEGCL